MNRRLAKHSLEGSQDYPKHSWQSKKREWAKHWISKWIETTGDRIETLDWKWIRKRQTALEPKIRILIKIRISIKRRIGWYKENQWSSLRSIKIWPKIGTHRLKQRPTFSYRDYQKKLPKRFGGSSVKIEIRDHSRVPKSIKIRTWNQETLRPVGIPKELQQWHYEKPT